MTQQSPLSSSSLTLLKLAKADLIRFYINAHHPPNCTKKTKKKPHPSSRQISEDSLISDAKMSLSGYIFSRLPSILPTFDPAPNPFKLLATVNQKQWMFFLVCLCSIFPHLNSYLESDIFPDCILCVGVGCLRFLHSVLDCGRPRRTVS